MTEMNLFLFLSYCDWDSGERHKYFTCDGKQSMFELEDNPVIA